MMQDTILSLGKESVKHFVDFMMRYIPKETHIKSTSHVVNIFEKKRLADGPSEEDDSPVKKVDIPESQMTHVQKVRKELDAMFAKDKDPEPLFVLDLILKPN